MHGRTSLFTVAACLLLGACAAEVAPLPDDPDVIHQSCVEVEPDTWECEQGVQAQIAGGVTWSAVPEEGGKDEPQVYGRVYDPPGCYYCGQHSGQGLYDWAPCPWGQSIYRFHCVACNYYSGYDRILYDCGTWTGLPEDSSELREIDGDLEVSLEE
ncbi:MAG TPA: hypothetical protein VFU21_14245 [Kofleriaceae bacterium]|nr:hypothetical protein [Kofleriaceae bacterium]